MSATLNTLFPGYSTGSLILIYKIFWDKRIQKPELNLWTVQSKNTGTVLDLPVYQEEEEATQIILSKEVV